MGTDTLAVVCPECETRTSVAFERSSEVVKNHNESMHDGESVAGVEVWFDDGPKILPPPEDIIEAFKQAR